MVYRLMIWGATGVRGRLRREEGQAFVEYSLVLLLVAVAVALLAQWDLFRDAIVNALDRVGDALSGAGQEDED